MMDGYSVQDAASVLGVPEGRVWELLARGVLNGTPEGDSMRVFLKADAPAAPRPVPREELPRSNGNGGSHGAEASAFRELLTEFRNLTERYGQALLALGEARGEVAGLRSRVEQLEARIDLRLPSRVEAEPISWEAPQPRASAPAAPAPEAPAPEPPAPAEVEAVLPDPAPVERAARPRKARSTRAAVAGFAEALARAQDPNLADVGDGQAEAQPIEMAAEAEPVEMVAEPEPVEMAAEPEPVEMAAEREPVEMAAEPEPIEIAAEPEPVEIAAEPEPVEIAVEPLVDLAEEVAPAAELAPAAKVAPAAKIAPAAPEPQTDATYRATVIEPDWFADGDFSWLDAADLEARAQLPVEKVDVEKFPEELGPEVEPDLQAAVVPEPVAEAAEAGQAADAAVPTEPEIVAETSPGLEPILVEEVASEPTVAGIIEPGLPTEPAAVSEAAPEPVIAPQMEPVEMSAASEEAVLWLGGQPEPAEELEVAGVGWYSRPTLAPRIRDALVQTALPAPNRVAAPVETIPPPLTMTEEELAQLARDEGWDETEVAAIRAMISRPVSSTVELPGSAELDEAISALQAVPVAPRSAPAPGSQWAKPAARDEETRRDDWAFEVEAPQPAASQPRFAPRRAAPDPDWVRRRRGPAATAYRRIRRLFSG
jgi:hypothetical protein